MKDISKKLVSLSEKLQKQFSYRELSVSALVDDREFLVNSYDSYNRKITGDDIIRLGLEPVPIILKSKFLNNRQIKKALSATEKPELSSESLIHALCLTAGKAKFVAHSHSIAVNKILCSKYGSTPFQGHIFAESVLVCGKTPATIPFVESAYFLAKAVNTELLNYQKIHYKTPKLLLMENHGHIALGQSSEEVLKIMQTLEYWAEILLTTYSLGGPAFLSHEQIIAIEESQI